MKSINIYCLFCLLIFCGCLQGPPGVDGKSGTDGKVLDRDSISVDINGLWIYSQMHNPINFWNRKYVSGTYTEITISNFEVAGKQRALYDSWDSSIVNYDSVKVVVSKDTVSYNPDVFIRLPKIPNGWSAVAIVTGRHLCKLSSDSTSEWGAKFSRADTFIFESSTTVNKTTTFCSENMDGTEPFVMQVDFPTYYFGKGFPLFPAFRPRFDYFYTGELKIYYW